MSGSRRAQKSAMNFSASSSDATFFQSFFSASVVRYWYSGDFSQSLYLSSAAARGPRRRDEESEEGEGGDRSLH